MRRVLVLCLIAAMLVTAIPVVSARQEDACGHNPVILLPGYMASALAYNDGADEPELVPNPWGAIVDVLLPQLVPALQKLTQGLVTKDYDAFASLAAGVLGKIFDPYASNPDGRSVEDLAPYPSGAEDSNYAVRLAREEEHILEEMHGSEFAEVVGADHVYSFSNDWRLSQIENAHRLHAFIQEVKEYSGHDQVDLFGISYGGQLGAVYLYYYALEHDVDRAVLNVPAIGGSTVLADMMNGTIALDFVSLLEFNQIGERKETEFEKLLKLIDFSALNKSLPLALSDFTAHLKNWAGSWDLIPTKDYDALKAKLLDPVENKEIIAISDTMHYEVMPNMGKKLQEARANGVQVSIMANCGRPLLTGTQLNSDYIIDTASTSGAKCMPLGERFAQDYTAGADADCTDPTHYHISPGREIDAAYAYLPEHTWFIDGQYHGQSQWDPYSNALYRELLWGDTLQDVYSSPEYPQFAIAQNPADGLFVNFPGTISGYLRTEDNMLEVRNLSASYPITLCDITIDGFGLELSAMPTARILAGETVEIPIKQKADITDITPFTIKVDYVLHGEIPGTRTRTIAFSAIPEAVAQTMRPFNNMAAPIEPERPSDVSRPVPVVGEATHPVQGQDVKSDGKTTVDIPETGVNYNRTPQVLLACSLLLATALLASVAQNTRRRKVCRAQQNARIEKF